MRTVVVLDVVGLTPKMLAHMPGLSAFADAGSRARLDPTFPAVTCTVQSSMLTGETASGHGIVGNGWYFRELGEVLLWRQHNALVQGEKVWDAARRSVPDYQVANLCWWYAMGAATQTLVTPRPIYHADGRKSPDAYTRPPELHDRLVRELGDFPLFSYWGPTAGIASSRWIAEAARRVLSVDRPNLMLVYLPHLDYDLQRYGPDGPAAAAAAAELDDVLAPLLASCTASGATVVVLSEYGIVPVSRPVDVNRALRRAGLLEVHEQAGMEYLDPWTSRAFAVADHQVAHVYVRDPSDVDTARSVLAALPGIGRVLDGPGKASLGVDHDRSGELVCLADPDAWFTYYYWLDDRHAPDFARGVEIHRKPGYDPAELFLDPTDRLVKARAASALVKKRLGLRYTMSVVPLDPSPVRGSHGLLPGESDADDSPVLLCSLPDAVPGRLRATDVKDLLLRLAEVEPADARS